MAIELDDLITPEGDINVLDRTGGRINVTITEDGEQVDLSTWDLYFESGDVSIALVADGFSQYFILTPEHLESLSLSQTTRFAVIDKTTAVHSPIWEGFIFIRSVD